MFRLLTIPQNFATNLLGSLEVRPQSRHMDREIIKGIIDRVAGGEALKDICTAADAPCARSTFYVEVAKAPDLAIAYDLARAARSLPIEEEILEITDRVLGRPGAGEKIDPRAAQVALNAKMWLLERMDPRRFGSRQETTVNEGKSSYVADLERAQGMIKRAEPLPASVVELKKADNAA